MFCTHTHTYTHGDLVIFTDNGAYMGPVQQLTFPDTPPPQPPPQKVNQPHLSREDAAIVERSGGKPTRTGSMQEAAEAAEFMIE